MNYNKKTYFNNTTALFTEVEKPNREADYISESGSKYWYEETGVFRESDHWGEISQCYWSLVDSNFKHILNNEINCGFSEWEYFRPSTCIYDLEIGVYSTILGGIKTYIFVTEKGTEFINEKGNFEKATFIPSAEKIIPTKSNNIPFKELDSVFHLFKGWGVIVEKLGNIISVVFNNKFEKIEMKSNDYQLLSFSEYNLKNGGLTRSKI